MKLDSTVFFTNNLDQSVSFFKDKLEFNLEYVQGDSFASFVFENDAKLGIKKPTKDREVPGHQTIFISTDNIEETIQNIKDKDVELYEDLNEKEGWGKYFSVLDPDENKVLYIQHS